MLVHFCNFSLQVIQHSVSYLKTLFVTAHKACLENFYEKVSETWIGDNVGKGCDCLCDLFFYFGDGLMSLK